MMTPELYVLVLAALLQVLQMALMAVPANIELGTKKTLSPRDLHRLGGSLESQVSVRTARSIRAMNNHFEGLLLFAIAVMAVTLSAKSTYVTEACAWIYLVARIIYVPAYVFGWVPWRSIVWFAGFLSTVVILLSVLF